MTLPLWSVIDIVMGGGGHNLLPFEWAIYGIYAVIGVVGAIIGRLVTKKKHRHASGDAI